MLLNLSRYDQLDRKNKLKKHPLMCRCETVTTDQRDKFSDRNVTSKSRRRNVLNFALLIPGSAVVHMWSRRFSRVHGRKCGLETMDSLENFKRVQTEGRLTCSLDAEKKRDSQMFPPWDSCKPYKGKLITVGCIYFIPAGQLESNEPNI